MKSKRLVVQMEPKLKQMLERYSKQSGVPISEFVRRAIVEALKKQSNKRSRQARQRLTV